MASWSRERDGAVTLLTLTRPPVNALDRAALDELADRLTEVEADAETRAVVVTSGLAGVFCSGGDLKYWRTEHHGEQVGQAGREVFRRLEELPVPTIAAINGHVIGDGLMLALACDLRIATEAATFRLPEAAYGFIPGWGPIRKLVDLAGRGSASELILTGRPIGAERAWIIGLVNRVVPPDGLVDEAIECGREVATFSPVALHAAKCALRGADESACFRSVWGGPDWHEGINALFAKRQPAFAAARRGDEGHDLVGRVQESRAARRGDRCC